jgi:hypothetical protein
VSFNYRSIKLAAHCRFVSFWAVLAAIVALALSRDLTVLRVAVTTATIAVGGTAFVMSHLRLRREAPDAVYEVMRVALRPMTGWEIARATGLPPVFVHPLLDQLVGDGLVVDSWGDEKRPRRAYWQTRKGAAPQ